MPLHMSNVQMDPSMQMGGGGGMNMMCSTQNGFASFLIKF